MGAYFKHGKISFYGICEDDLLFLMELRNDFSTWTHLGDPRVLKPGLQKKWLDGLNQSRTQLYFIAQTARDGRIGLVRMDEYDLINRSIRVGADVIPNKRGEGYGNSIYEAMEAYSFDFLGLHRIWLLVLDGNDAARELYRRRGFKTEGRMRQAIFRGGKWRDYIMMSLLEPEYRDRKRG